MSGYSMYREPVTPLVSPRARPSRVTITYYGCREYLCRIGMIPGVLEVRSLAPPAVTVDAIQTAVSDYYGLPKAEMKSARRAREVARPRQVSMYLSKALTPRSLPEIGQYHGGRDHTTVIHAVRQIKKLRAEDPDLDLAVSEITESLTRELEG